MIVFMCKVRPNLLSSSDDYLGKTQKKTLGFISDYKPYFTHSFIAGLLFVQKIITYIDLVLSYSCRFLEYVAMSYFICIHYLACKVLQN